MPRKPLIRWRRSASRDRKFKLLRLHARRRAKELIKKNDAVAVYQKSLKAVDELFHRGMLSEFDRELHSYRIPWDLFGKKYFQESKLESIILTELMFGRALALISFIKARKKIPSGAFLDAFHEFSIATEHVEGSSFPFLKFFNHGKKVFGKDRMVDVYKTPFRVEDVLDGLKEGIKILSAYEESQVGFKTKLLMDAVRLQLLKERKNFEKRSGLGDTPRN